MFDDGVIGESIDNNDEEELRGGDDDDDDSCVRVEDLCLNDGYRNGGDGIDDRDEDLDVGSLDEAEVEGDELSRRVRVMRVLL